MLGFPSEIVGAPAISLPRLAGPSQLSGIPGCSFQFGRTSIFLGRVPSPPTSPDNFAKRTQVGGLSKHSPLQTIADAIKRLVWDDNEKLGQMISEHYGEGNSGSMASAVQRAADDLLAEGKD